MHSKINTLGVRALLKKFFKKLWSGAVMWLWFILSIWIFIIVYAAWRTVMTPVWTWSWLTASSWNQMIDNLNDLNGRLLWVSNVWGKIGIWTINPATKLNLYWDANELRLDFPTTSSYNTIWFRETGVQKWFLQNIGSNFSDVNRRGDIEIQASAGDLTLQSINGGNVWIWTTSPGATLQVNGTMKIFWPHTTWYTFGTAYLASTDGFVLVNINYSWGQYNFVKWYTDSLTNPTTLVASDSTTWAYWVDFSSILFPVRKGDYWKVEWVGTAPVSSRIQWTPFWN